MTDNLMIGVSQAVSRCPVAITALVLNQFVLSSETTQLSKNSMALIAITCVSGALKVIVCRGSPIRNNRMLGLINTS